MQVKQGFSALIVVASVLIQGELLAEEFHLYPSESGILMPRAQAYTPTKQQRCLFP